MLKRFVLTIIMCLMVIACKAGDYNLYKTYLEIQTSYPSGRSELVQETAINYADNMTATESSRTFYRLVLEDLMANKYGWKTMSVTKVWKPYFQNGRIIGYDTYITIVYTGRRVPNVPEDVFNMPWDEPLPELQCCLGRDTTVFNGISVTSKYGAEYIHNDNVNMNTTFYGTNQKTFEQNVLFKTIFNSGIGPSKDYIGGETINGLFTTDYISRTPTTPVNNY